MLQILFPKISADMFLVSMCPLYISLSSSFPIRGEVAPCWDHLLCRNHNHQWHWYGRGDAADKHKQIQTSRFSEVFGRQSICLLVSMLVFEASLSVANYFPTKSSSCSGKCQSIKGGRRRRLNCLLTQRHLGPLTIWPPFIRIVTNKLTFQFRKHHGWRRRLFGDILGIAPKIVFTQGHFKPNEFDWNKKNIPNF